MDRDISAANEDQRAQIRSQHVGFVFQSFQLIDHLTALENVQLPLELAGMPRAEAAAKAEAAAGEGLAFLAENAKRDGITTLASGLQFEVLTAGEGAKPTREDQVRTHYHGTLIDGTVFDSSYERGQPAEFPVGGVIAGWTEALQLMNAGSKWRLYVPSELAYGAQGVGSIPPHSVLVFDVELLDVL